MASMLPAMAGSIPSKWNTGEMVYDMMEERKGAMHMIPAMDRAIGPSKENPSSNLQPRFSLFPQILSIPPISAPHPITSITISFILHSFFPQTSNNITHMID